VKIIISSVYSGGVDVDAGRQAGRHTTRVLSREMVHRYPSGAISVIVSCLQERRREGNKVVKVRRKAITCARSNRCPCREGPALKVFASPSPSSPRLSWKSCALVVYWRGAESRLPELAHIALTFTSSPTSTSANANSLRQYISKLRLRPGQSFVVAVLLDSAAHTRRRFAE
jgi:hypothetical protein